MAERSTLHAEQRGPAMIDDVLATPAEWLARASESDARHAQDILGRLGNGRLLEVVLSQAQLAVEPGRRRAAGIDALAELDRAAVELMGLAQGVAVSTTDDDLPLVTGWELMTLDDRGALLGATASVPARPWHLALIAFQDDRASVAEILERQVTAVTADGRYVTARIRLDATPGQDDATVLEASVSRHLEDTRAHAPLAWGLSRALLGAQTTV